MDYVEAVKVLECMAIDLVGALGSLSETNPLTDVLRQRIKAIDKAQYALRYYDAEVREVEALAAKKGRVLK